MKLKALLVKNKLINKNSKFKEIIDYVVEETKGLELQSIKFNPDFIKWIVEIIENQINASEFDEKPDKMVLFVDIMKKLYPGLSEAEIKSLKTLVEFLLDSKLIKKVPFMDVIVHYFKKQFSK